jgi:hypothetical protein
MIAGQHLKKKEGDFKKKKKKNFPMFVERSQTQTTHHAPINAGIENSKIRTDKMRPRLSTFSFFDAPPSSSAPDSVVVLLSATSISAFRLTLGLAHAPPAHSSSGDDDTSICCLMVLIVDWLRATLPPLQRRRRFVLLFVFFALVCLFAASSSIFSFLLFRVADARIALQLSRDDCGRAALPLLVVLDANDRFRIIQHPTCLTDVAPPRCHVEPGHLPLNASMSSPAIQVAEGHFVFSTLFIIANSIAPSMAIECVAVGESTRRRFQLPAAASSSGKFLIFSDAQSDTDVFRRLLSLGVGRVPRPAALVYGGDATQGSTPLQWAKFVSAIDEHLFQSVGDVVPLVIARGNHDAAHASPLNDIVLSAADRSHVVSVSIGAARIVVVDADFVLSRVAAAFGNESREGVAFFAALDAALEHEAWRAASFRIVVCHVPTVIEWWEPEAWFGRNEQREPRDIARLLWPRWRDAGVDIIVSGHSHMYSHRLLASHQVHEFIVGGGGGALETIRIVNASSTIVERIAHHFVAVDVQRCTLHWEARDINDEPIETLALAARRAPCAPS